MTAIPSSREQWKQWKSKYVETVMKAQYSYPASKIIKKVKARKETTFKTTAYLLTINIPPHLIHLYCSSDVSHLPNWNVLIILNLLLKTIYQITQSRHMILLAKNHMTWENKTNHIWKMDKENRKSSSVVSQKEQIQVQYRLLWSYLFKIKTLW